MQKQANDKMRQSASLLAELAINETQARARLSLKAERRRNPFPGIPATDRQAATTLGTGKRPDRPQQTAVNARN
nr:hypothetical protein [Pseudomonas sp.]